MTTATSATRFASRLAPLVLALAVIPPLLVFLDRWFGVYQLTDWYRSQWCASSFLCELVWRPYFVVILLCTVAVVALVRVTGVERIEGAVMMDALTPTARPSENQRRVGVMLLVSALLGVVITVVRLTIAYSLPGWDYILVCVLYLAGMFLLTTPREMPLKRLVQQWRVWLACGLGLAALSWLLFSYYGRSNVSVFALALCVVAIWALFWQRRNISPGYWLVLLALVTFTLYLNAWQFSIIGDEFAFHETAERLAFQANLGEVGAAFFDGVKVYGSHPYFSSLLQAPTFWLFDRLSFGWRYSSILPSALSVFLFYYVFRAFLARWVALTAAFLIAASHYLMVFSRIGYNNTQALLAMGLALAAATWAFRSRQRLAFVTFGLALAFCFYVFPAALYVTPVAVWLLLLYYPPRGREALVNWGAALGTLIMVILPLLFQPEYWTTKVLGGSVVLRADEVSNVSALAQRILVQLGYSFYSFLFVPSESHYLRVAYVDVATAVLVLVGLGVLLWRVRADRFALFVLSGLGMLLFFIGATHGTRVPPNTRMFLLVPWFCVVAAIGLQWLATRLAMTSGSSPGAKFVLGALLLGILGLNLYQAFETGVRGPVGFLEFDALLVQLAQNVNVGAHGAARNLVFVYDPKIQNLRSLQREMGIAYQPIQLVGIDATKRQPGALASQLKPAENLIVVSQRPAAEQIEPFQTFLKRTDWKTCDVESWAGQKRIEVWYAAPTPEPCSTKLPALPVRFPDPLLMGLLGLVLVGGLVGQVRVSRDRKHLTGQGAREGFLLPFGSAWRFTQESIAEPGTEARGTLEIKITARKTTASAKNTDSDSHPPESPALPEVGDTSEPLPENSRLG